MDQRKRGRRMDRIFAISAAIVAVAVAVPVAMLRWSANPAPAAGPEQDVARSCAGHPLAASRELRGMWITTVNNSDWPSRPGLDEKTVKAEFRAWLDLAQRLRFNAVFVHVRPSGDAFWPSEYAPWSQWLTGRLDGRGPGWDPLAFAVAEAHARNMEFHAWFNPYKATSSAPRGVGADFNRLPPTHPLRQHRQWAVTYPAKGSDSKLYYDPGNPEARRFVEDSILDAVNRYDIDGVHFDDFFYPYGASSGNTFDDRASFGRYGAGIANRGDWRRENVNRFVKEMNERIKAKKPWVKFGISPFGIWRNERTDPRGSATRGLQSYDNIYADTRLWVQRQWLDYIAPQLYWHIGFDIADYAKLLPWWAKTVAGTRVQLYIGQADYRVGQSGAWSDPAQLDRQLALNQKHQVAGSIHFTAKSVRADKLGAISRYVAAHHAAPALQPRMARPPAAVPATPVITKVRAAGAGKVALTWREGSGPGATSFAVYRVDKAGPSGAGAALIATVRSGGAARQTWTDQASSGHEYAYCVTALDRLSNESTASWPGELT